MHATTLIDTHTRTSRRNLLSLHYYTYLLYYFKYIQYIRIRVQRVPLLTVQYSTVLTKTKDCVVSNWSRCSKLVITVCAPQLVVYVLVNIPLECLLVSSSNRQLASRKAEFTTFECLAMQQLTHQVIQQFLRTGPTLLKKKTNKCMIENINTRNKWSVAFYQYIDNAYCLLVLYFQIQQLVLFICYYSLYCTVVSFEGGSILFYQREISRPLFLLI